MKNLLIPHLKTDNLNIQQIASVLKKQQSHSIDCLNWKHEFPSKPDVAFRIAHSDTILYIQYEVRENELLALTENDNGAVWKDSCVEFFVSFNGTDYYNLEFNCVGKVLVGCHITDQKTEYAAADTLSHIDRFSTLGSDIIEAIKGDHNWMLTVAIPITTFWKNNLNTYNGLKAYGNFYKCGDNLSTPHFLSWSPIETPSPSFHQPRFFGQLVFE